MRSAIAVAVVSVVSVLGGPADAAVMSKSRVDMPSGGLLVHVGCGTGAKIIQMAASGKWLAQGLSGSRDDVKRARARIISQGLSGLASADYWRGSRLPYADSMVTCLIVARSVSLTEREAVRVVAPGGVAQYKGKIIQKPWPKGMDGWTHPRHGADGNPVSGDTLTALPRDIRWIGDPRGYTRPLTSDGVCYMSSGRNVTARDAFNGVYLWRGRLDARAAGGGRIYGFNGSSVEALDAHTGKRVAAFGSGDAGTGTILYLGDTLVVAAPGEVRLHDAKTGRAAWTTKARGPRLAVARDGRIYYVDGNPRRGDKPVVVCLDQACGDEVWRSEAYDWLAKTTALCAGPGLLVCELSPYVDGGQCALHALDGGAGTHLWEHSYKPPMSHKNQARAMFLGKDLWIHQGGFTKLDSRTGKKTRSVPGGRGHCFPAIATTRYLIHGELNFTDSSTGKVEANRITKGACGKNPFIPANGMLYGVAKNCICFPMIHGHTALASSPAPRTKSRRTVISRESFDKGPAFGKKTKSSRSKRVDPKEWPIYRRDRFRSGRLPTTVPPGLKALWRSPVLVAPPKSGNQIAREWEKHPFAQGAITAPTIADGRVYVAVPSAHRVIALSAATGRPLWTYTANGMIDTPPTVHRGHCLFGTRTGWVHCVTADKGKLVWRMLGGPMDRRIVAWGQVESAWPVSGSVLAHNGIVFFSAGRTPLADGGVHVSAARVTSGKLLIRQVVDSLGIKAWYGRLGEDYDPVDLMVFDGESELAVSRARLDTRTGKIKVDRGAGAFYQTDLGVHVPVGTWSYGRSMRRDRSKRPLYVFDNVLLYGGKPLSARTLPRKSPSTGGREWSPFRDADKLPARWSSGIQGVAALALGGDNLFVADAGGKLRCLGAADGKKKTEVKLDGAPVWDGLALAYGRTYISLANGCVACFGDGRTKVPAPGASSRK